MYLPIKRARPSPAAASPASAAVGLQGLLSADPAAFRAALSIVRIGRTFKTTARNRLPLVTEYLAARGGRLGTVIDVGASDGSASMSLIEALDFERYYLTDKYMQLRLTRSGRIYRLYDADDVLHMCQIGGLVCYLDPFRAWRSPLERLVTASLGHPGELRVEETHEITCVTPELAGLGKPVHALGHDCGRPWMREQAELVLVANFLDKFVDRPDLMQVFCHHIAGMLQPGGTLVVADNEGAERATVFTMDGSPRPVQRLGGGSVAEQALVFTQ